MNHFSETLKTFGMNFLAFAIVLVIGVVVVRLLLIPIKRVMVKSRGEHTVKTFLFSLIKVALYGLVAITALGTAHVDVGSLLTALGAAAITAGLALQDTLRSFVSGVIIIFTKPFTAGDLIQFEGYEGYIDSIRIFYTQIHTFDNRTVQIPNSRLTTNNVVNCSVRGTRRIDIKFSVSYEDNLTKVKSVVYAVIANIPEIIGDPEPKVYISNHLDSGVEVFAMVWVKEEDYYPALFRMEEDVKNAFDENGITIPYPHVHLVENVNNSE